MKTWQLIKQTRRGSAVVCFALAVIVAFSWFLSKEYAQEAIRDVQDAAHAKMDHIVQNTRVTLDHFQIYGQSMMEDPAICNWLISAANGPMEDFEAFKAARKYQGLQPFISDIILINDKTKRVIDAEYGVTGYSDFRLPGLLEQQVRTLPKYAGFDFWREKDRSYIRMTVPVPGSPSSALVVLFDKDKLEQFLFKSNENLGFSIRLTNGDGELMLGQPAAPSASRVEDETREYLDNPPWTFVFTADKAAMTRHIGAFQRKITAACVSLGAILLLLMVWGSIRTLRPLLESVQQMHTSLRNYRDIAKEEYLRQWILQSGEGHIRRGLAETGVLPRLSRPRMAIFRIESYKPFSDRYNYPSRKLFKYAMGNIACEIARGEGYEAEAVDMDGDHFVLLFSPVKEQSHETAPEPMLAVVRDKIGEYLQIPTAVAVSRPLEPEEPFRKIYEETYDLTLLKFLSGEEKIYSEADLERSFQVNRSLPDDVLLGELVKAVKMSDADRMRLLIGQLTEGLRKLPFEDLRFQLRMIVYTLFKSFSKVIDLQETAGTEHLISRFSSLAEVMDWLENQLVRIIDSQKSKPESGRKDEIAQEIVDYIANHLQDPALSLDSISDHLGLSSSYVRHVFKDVYKITLADYLLQQRIEKVKRLLTETNLPVAEIAESAGFLTKSHFYTAFKKSEGMTPAQYRSARKIGQSIERG
jgi:AraC-like DNA-binding protein